MKIILKEFIKKNCTLQNQVLCSYFIKTFLFWKFEMTDAQFWREGNFRECIKYLIAEFAHCLQDGELRHYFIPSFNLFSVKLTREAQSELLQLFDIVTQYDMSILKECKTLRPVWSKFLSADKNLMRIRINALKSNLKKNDALMVKNCYKCQYLFHKNALTNSVRGNLKQELRQFQHLINRILFLPTKTNLKPLLIKRILLDKYIESLIKPYPGNKKLYKLQRVAHNESLTFDLSTNKLWYVVALLSKRDFTSALSIIKKLLSSIPPFHFCLYPDMYNKEAKQLYVDKFMNSGITLMERAKEAWMLPLRFNDSITSTMPLAIQIELYFCDGYVDWLSVCVSPFVLIYYLAFQCYHELGQNDHRDNALRQLLDAVKADEPYSVYNISYHYSLNIAGHCLLVAGDRDQARRMFILSNQLTKELPKFVPTKKGTAASWYLQHFC